ncbi:hypothetical protein NMY22_g12204 [Coprinellus aureogranulatus]|nr:hypothetical protein NMY22_g12204 [Coprinellus aureogranulatus]
MANFSVALAFSLFAGYLVSNASAAPTPGEVYRVANPAPDQTHTARDLTATGIRENILGRAPVEHLAVGRRGPSTSWDNRAEASGYSKARVGSPPTAFSAHIQQTVPPASKGIMTTTFIIPRLVFAFAFVFCLSWSVLALPPSPGHVEQASNLVHRHGAHVYPSLGQYAQLFRSRAASGVDLTSRNPGTAWDNRADNEDLNPRRCPFHIRVPEHPAGVFAFSLILISSLILTVSGQPDSVVPGDASPEGKTNIVTALRAGTNWDGCRRAAPPPPPPAYWYAHLSHVKQLCHGMQVLTNLLPSVSGLVIT